MALKNSLYQFSILQPTTLAFLNTIVFLILYALNLNEVIWIFLGIGFLSIGLSHGALDHLMDKTIQGWKQLIRFMVIFLIKGSLLGLLWIILPDAALLAFIVFSAWHFGQADFMEWNIKQGIHTFTWGLIVLSSILLFHLDETLLVLQDIKGLQVHHLLKNVTEKQLLIGKLILLFISVLFIIYNKSKWMFITISYLLLSTMLPLLFSFGIYFITQHSMQGWKHLKKDLKLNSYKLWLKSLPFGLGGIFIFAIFIVANINEYRGLFFIVLSGLSMQHVFSMHHFYGRFGKKSN